MTNQLKMMVGVAVFAMLALAGTLGVFAFAAVQPAQAQDSLATRTISPATVAPGGEVSVTIEVSGSGTAPEVRDTWPVGYTYKEGSATGGTAHVNASNRTIRILSFSSPATFSYMLTAPTTAGTGTFSGTVSAGDVDGQAIGGASMITVSTTPAPMPMAGGSVEALPEDPGAAAQITVRFELDHGLNIDESIVIEVDDNTGVPDSIAAGNVSISDGPDTASPRSVVVETDSVAERYRITLFIGDMSDVEGAQNLKSGNIAVTFRQEAGITNRTEGGSDDWFYRTSRDDELTKIANVYTVPRLVELSSYGDSRGEDITAVGKGFKNGTTVRFWRDANEDGVVGAAEVTLCSATATGDDIAECSFPLSNPPFMGGTEGNYINAIDGRNNTVSGDLPNIELEPSMSVNPKAGSPGDNINVQLYDFTPNGDVDRIQFGRSRDICNDDTSGMACEYGTIGPNGSLSFSFEIPNGITPGAQDLKVWATGGDDNTTFAVGLGSLQVSSAEVLPNQRISITGSGFTTSRGQASAYIGASADIPNDSACPASYGGAVLLGGTQIPWDRVNDGDAIEVTSGGTWAGSLDLPINSLTTTASTRELKIVDCMAGVATMDLSFPDREVTMSPERGRVGSEVIITGKNFPAANDDGSDVEITVMYDADGDVNDDDVEPDGLGNFTVILEVPEDAGIPSNNTVTVQFTDDRGATVTETRTHRVPQGTVSFGAASGAEGSLLTINAEGFARYTSVSEVMFGDRDITPSPKPSTSTTGDVEFEVRIPGSDPGIYIIKVEVADVTATQTFTVVSGSGVVDGSVDSILANVISEDALDRVFKFDNMTKDWQWYINDPAFASTNNLAGLSSGDLVWIKVSKSVTADILGTSTSLSCINEGAENEDCWNQISIP